MRFGKFFWFAVAMWYGVGFFAAVLGFGLPSRFFELSVPLWFPVVTGGVWAIAGVLPIVALPTWFDMSFERCVKMRHSNPAATALMASVARSLVLGALIGFSLARWVTPHLGLPDDVQLGATHSVVGTAFTALVYAGCVPLAARVGRYLR